MSQKLIDLSHTIEDGMITCKGLPAPIICDYWSRNYSRQFYAEGVDFQIGKIEMVANTGTYVDSPFHRYANGKDLSELELTCLANLETIAFRCAHNQRAIPHTEFGKHDLRGKAVLIHTDWARDWHTERYFEGHPYLTNDAAAYLVESGARLVGIDSYNIDDTADKRRPAHSLLLRAEIPIVEHMCGLEQMPEHGARFFAVPVKVKAFGTFPVRAFAIVD